MTAVSATSGRLERHNIVIVDDVDARPRRPR